MDVVGLVRQAAPIGYASLQRGIISGGQSHPKAAPTAFTEAVLVILPEASTEHLYGPLRWPALHGTSKPQPGAECVLGFDEQHRPSLLWWEGPQAEPVPGAESITEGMLKAEAVTEGKLAAAVVAKLNPSAWAAPESFSAKLEETTSVQVRTEQGKTVVRLKGFAKTKEEIAAKGTVFTLPAGFRPPEDAQVALLDSSAATVSVLRVKSTGVVETEQKMVAAHFFAFAAITFNLT